jgi:hypothetical protein
MKTEAVVAKHLPALDALAATIRDRIDIAENVLTQYIPQYDTKFVDIAGNILTQYMPQYDTKFIFHPESVQHLFDNQRILNVWNVSGGLFSESVVGEMRALDGLGKSWHLQEDNSWKISFGKNTTLVVRSFPSDNGSESRNAVHYESNGETIILEDISRFEVYPRHVAFVKTLGIPITELVVRNDGTAMPKSRPPSRQELQEG